MSTLVSFVFLFLELTPSIASQCITEERTPIKSRSRQILTPNGKGVSVEIQVFSRGEVIFQTRSDSNGKFSIKVPKNENYRVRFFAPGFGSYQYILSGSGKSRKTLKLLPSRCNDMLVTEQ